MSVLAAEVDFVATKEIVAANETVKEVVADEQHIINVVEGSESDDSDGDSSDGNSDDFLGDVDDFPEGEEDPEEAASRKRAREVDERNQAIMYQHAVDDAVFEATEELFDNEPVLCGVCEGGGHTDLLLLCDGQDLQKPTWRVPVTASSALKKRKPEQKCAVACHTFCCAPPL
jgi:hypothetical protein